MMSFEKAESSVPPSEGSNGHKDICVLVVDCDQTCLLTISRMLRAMTYQVKTVGRAADALAMTLDGENQVDLVMTELHMPGMDGLQLLDEIQRTSKLPVVIMSADADEDAMMRSLNKGAIYYMDKPVEKGNLKNLWQYVFLNRREKRKNRQKILRAESLGENEPDKYAGSGQITSRKHGYQQLTSDAVETGKDDEDDTLTSCMRKKPKLVWTNELHEKFLNAIAELGLDCAHPKKILRIMGVEGLTNEQISSHLQKYRRSVKRDRLAVRSGLQFATRKTPMDYFGLGFMPSQNRSLYKFSHGIQAPNLLLPSMASQLGFSAYMQRNHASPSNMKHGQYCCCPSMCLHGLNHTAMDFNARRPSHGWCLFNNAIMFPPQPWMLPPPPPSQGQGTDNWTFTGDPETNAWVLHEKWREEAVPKIGF